MSNRMLLNKVRGKLFRFIPHYHQWIETSDANLNTYFWCFWCGKHIPKTTFVDKKEIRIIPSYENPFKKSVETIEKT